MGHTTYSAFNIPCFMDLPGGILILAPIEILRSLETKGKIYYHESLIPPLAIFSKYLMRLKKLVKLEYSFQ